MSNVVHLFAKPSTVQLYSVEDPGLTWYEEGASYQRDTVKK